MKKMMVGLLALALSVGIIGCSGGKSEEKSIRSKQMSEFYEKVSESQELLDSVADDVYSNWYDAIYKDKFNDDINLAIVSARIDHKDDLDKIETLDEEITKLFKKVKNDEKIGDLIKDVMSAYSDYYEFVVNVSGSFKSYSADKETLKKELASLLKDLSYEL